MTKTVNHAKLLKVGLDDGVRAVRCCMCLRIGELSRYVNRRPVCVKCDRIGDSAPPAQVQTETQAGTKPVAEKKDVGMENKNTENGGMGEVDGFLELLFDEAVLHRTLEQLEDRRENLAAEMKQTEQAIAKLRILLGEAPTKAQKPRQTYTPEQKAALIRLVTQEGVAIAQAAEQLGFPEKTAYRIAWEHQNGGRKK